MNTNNEEWLEELFKSFTPPTVGGFKITHANDKITLPVGKFAQLNDTTLTV